MDDVKVDQEVDFNGTWAIVSDIDEDGTVWVVDEDGGEHEATADQLD